MLVIFLNKISIFPKKLADVVDATQNNFGFKGDYYFDGRPAVYLLYLPQS